MAPRLHRTGLALPAATLALLALAGCGSSSNGSSADAANGSTSAASPQAAGSLKTADSSLGRIVVDGKGMTAYYFTKDKANSGTSACTGQCLQAWPPITTTSATPQATGVTGKVGTITLPNGSKQVTVNGRPVYLFASDAKPGDVQGQGVGSVWYVLRPDGTMVTDQASGSSGGY
jgi:predicted lipoprotein with Yx(FWY)xxD motif